MTIDIKSITGKVLYTATSATDVRTALAEAIEASADLRYADLSSADLSSADLRSADLSSADLSSADLSSADLRSADLSYADLSSANLRSADLSSAELSGVTTILSVTGLPSGHAILMPTPDGWALRVGCWTGTVTELRELIAQDHGWPEATGDEITKRRPMLTALADMCDAWAATHQWALDRVIATWATPAAVEAPATTETGAK